MAGTAVRAVDRAIDERLLPDDFYTHDGGRRLTAGACVMIAFHQVAADQFTARLRRTILDRFEDRLRRMTFERYGAYAQEDWQLEGGYWTVDLAPFIERTALGYEELRAAEAVVSSSDDIMGGVHVLTGTRIPVHDISASAASGEPLSRLREAYPSLTDRQIELAIVYAAAHPQRGRPRGITAPLARTGLVERKVVSRKTAG